MAGVELELLRGFLWTQPILCADLFSEESEAFIEHEGKLRILKGRAQITEFFGVLPPVRSQIKHFAQYYEDCVAELTIIERTKTSPKLLILIYNCEAGQIKWFRLLVA